MGQPNWCQMWRGAGPDNFDMHVKIVRSAWGSQIAVGKAAKPGAESPSLEKRVASGEHAEATPAKAAASSFDLAGSASGSTRVRQPYEAPPPGKQLGPSIHEPMRVEDFDHDEAPPEGKLAASTKGGEKGIPAPGGGKGKPSAPPGGGKGKPSTSSAASSSWGSRPQHTQPSSAPWSSSSSSWQWGSRSWER